MDVPRRSKIACGRVGRLRGDGVVDNRVLEDLLGGQRPDGPGGDALEHDGRPRARVSLELDAHRNHGKREVSGSSGHFEERPVGVASRELDARQDLVVPEPGGERTGEEVGGVDPALARWTMGYEGRVECDDHSGQLGRGICMRKAAADRGSIANRPMGDLANRLCEKRDTVPDERGVLELRERRPGADAQQPVLRVDPRELGDSTEVDERARLRDPKSQQWEQALAAGKRLRLWIRGQHLDRLRNGCRRAIRKRRKLHVAFPDLRRRSAFTILAVSVLANSGTILISLDTLGGVEDDPFRVESLVAVSSGSSTTWSLAGPASFAARHSANWRVICALMSSITPVRPNWASGPESVTCWTSSTAVASPPPFAASL